MTTSEDAQRAITELSGKDLVERKVSVQLARLPTAKNEEASPQGEQAEGKRGRGGLRGRGRGRGGRGGAKVRDFPSESGRRTRSASGREANETNIWLQGARGEQNGTEEKKDEAPTNVPGQVLPLTETTNITAETTAVPAPASVEKKEKKHAEENKDKAQKKRGPPENGVPSKTKVMVANLPYELSEEKVSTSLNDMQDSC